MSDWRARAAVVLLVELSTCRVKPVLAGLADSFPHRSFRLHHVAGSIRGPRRAHQHAAGRRRSTAAGFHRRRRTRGAHTRRTSTAGRCDRSRSVDDSGMMLRFVQAETSTNRRPCVLRNLLCRCPTCSRLFCPAAGLGRMAGVRALWPSTEHGEAPPCAWSGSNLQSALQTASE